MDNIGNKNSISTPSRIWDIINRHDFVIQKRYGQNFLADSNIIDKIIASAQVIDTDYIIEIGPGLGGLTEALAQKSKHVYAIEIDKKLVPILNDTLSCYDNITIIMDDVLKLDLNSIIANNCEGNPVKIIANLPYYITTPIIMKLLEEVRHITSITVMIQKEVGNRILAKPGTKDYGSLTLGIKYYSVPTIVTNVPATCFIPRPNVDSIVVQLIPHNTTNIVVDNPNLLFSIISSSFNQRRKTLLNALTNSSNLDYNRDKIAEAISNLSLRPDIRGEMLTLEEFCDLTNILDDSL